jgi:hypothetical protein
MQLATVYVHSEGKSQFTCTVVGTGHLPLHVLLSDSRIMASEGFSQKLSIL